MYLCKVSHILSLSLSLSAHTRTHYNLLIGKKQCRIRNILALKNELSTNNKNCEIGQTKQQRAQKFET